MHPSALISAADIRQYIGKRKLANGAGLSGGSKKSRPNVLMVIIRPVDVPSTIVGQVDVSLIVILSAAGGSSNYCVDPSQTNRSFDNH